MRSIEFPKMFNSNNTRVLKSTEHRAATLQNAKLLFGTERGEVFGDPFYGPNFRRLLFDQNDYVIKDAVIDLLYDQLCLFLPQVRINRNDIEIVQDREKGKLYCNFYGINQITYQPDSYSLVLFDNADKITR